ncbi:TerB family tellurite resistance protein [Chryseolinea sp. H1M3-3]|uniref:TerB family tellurite resistance protein n=1 Tax=Chryseolinea sp. H1M3-3 TaxID=3034144 RepID=UPI0023EBBE6E|nr:TerB family tellurite resistance protein [Chryseolinea sp. H1M3-3]
MSYKSILTQLYFILIYADGQVNDHERCSGKNLVKIERFDEEDFQVQLEFLKSKDPSAILSDCIKALKKLDRNQQIRVVAWLCVVANGDGFMDKMEWQLIYTIYHKELNLPLEEIFKVQKELNRLPREKSSFDSSIKSVA